MQSPLINESFYNIEMDEESQSFFIQAFSIRMIRKQKQKRS